MTRSRPAEIDSLLKLSSRIGENAMLVQGSTGNTSLKSDGLLWIKASGKWLSDALIKDILVPVNLLEARRCVREGAEPVSSDRLDHESGLRASIETAMHAILPDRVVVHVHSINAIAWAVRQDAPECLRECLSGLAWQWIPYSASGLALAHEIEEAISRHPETDVFVLGNHGLVIVGNECEAAEVLLSEVESRLSIAPRSSPEPDLEVLELITSYSEWRLPPDRDLHTLGTDAVSRLILSQGILYPCQGIFLSTGYSFCPSEASRTQPFLVVNDRGVLIRNSISRAEYAILLGLSRVIQRVDPGVPIRYLEQKEIQALKGFESRQYRQLCEHKSQFVDSLTTA